MTASDTPLKNIETLSERPRPPLFRISRSTSNLKLAGSRALNHQLFPSLRIALRTIHRLHKANSVVICAVFFIKPR
jgi:hypothetical protein